MLQDEHAKWLLIQEAKAKAKNNPAIKLYGPGPLDRRCKTCRHIRYQLARPKWLCGITDAKGDPAWPTCSNFEAQS